MTGIGLDQMPGTLTRGDAPGRHQVVLDQDRDYAYHLRVEAGALTSDGQRILAGRRFAGLPGQVGVARRWLANMIDGFASADEVLLACSELASNAVMHSDSGLPGGVFTVRLTITSEFIRIEVLDQGGPWSGQRHPVDDPDEQQKAASQRGRGLAIVAAITDAWGIAGDQEGRTAWCEIKSE
jgi:serine/threonine-protein kinase RsbW